MCHAPIGILYTGMAEKLRRLEILKQQYLNNRLTDFYGTRTKLYLEASSIVVCGKENGKNNLKFRCNMPTHSLSGRNLWPITFNDSLFSGTDRYSN